MNFSQRFGLFILIAIAVAYVYFSFFNGDFNALQPKQNETEYNPLEAPTYPEKKSEDKNTQKNIKIYWKILLFSRWAGH